VDQPAAGHLTEPASATGPRRACGLAALTA
jgi:hypothetical protein